LSSAGSQDRRGPETPGKRLWIFRLLALFLGTLAALLLLEAGLRIFDPFGFRSHGSTLVLPRSKRYHIPAGRTPWGGGVQHSKNELGFRGESFPEAPAARLKVIALGGSTTECFYLSDGEDWPSLTAELLADAFPSLWMNNAGLDGHSTRGHLVLLREALLPLEPDVVLIYAGINDLARTTLNDVEKDTIFPALRLGTDAMSFKSWIARSRLLSSLYNILNSLAVQEIGVGHGRMDFASLGPAEFTPGAREEFLASVRAGAPGYEFRLRKMIEGLASAGALPVLITQPTVLGGGTDPVSGADLDAIAFASVDGASLRSALEILNETTRRMAREVGLPLIDVASRLPSSSRYYYDFFHYTPDGSAAVAAIVADGLCPVLTARFPLLRDGECPPSGPREVPAP